MGYFIIGDNAYTPAEYLIPIFGGADRNNVDNDNCNFYMSQVRIRVEMVFGMMVNRFGLLRGSPLQISVHHIGPLLQCVAKLHNYMLDENNSYKAQVRTEESLVPTTREEELGRDTNGDLP
jgi:hypothetical protein